MPNASVRETARKLVAASVSVIPIKADGTKAPAGKLLPLDEDKPNQTTWRPYQERIANDKELVHWFSKQNVGMAAVAGKVSGNLEILDIDEPALVRPWYEMVAQVAPGLVSKLVVVKTPREGHGRHCYYRCDVIEGNTKLAQGLRSDENGHMKVTTLIETRGEGGYALIPPSPAKCHKLNRPYVLSQGDLANIPTITEDERNVMLNCARTLTQYVEPERVYTPRQETTPTGERPGDINAAKVSWEDILMLHGWRVAGRRGEVTLWCRPGKKDGISATTGHCGDHLYVFSSNAFPFEPERVYSKFTAYTVLNFNGDFRKANTALAALGYIAAHSAKHPSQQVYSC
jgi:hypothetical protein